MDWPQPIRRYVNWKTPPIWLRDPETGKIIPPMAGGSPFRIPNKTTDALQDLAEPDVVDFHILAGGYDRTGVVTGCAVTAQGSPDMTVAVAAGTVLVKGIQAIVASGNVTIGAADGSNPRFDLVVANSAGTKSAIAGTASANPVFPTAGLLDADDRIQYAVLAAVYVPANDAAINSDQIVDKRIFCHIPSRAATFFVAANNASPQSKAMADFICDGTNDESEINSALSLLPASIGGKVILSEGTFTLGGLIDMVANSWLAGMDYATNLSLTGNHPAIRINGLDDCTITDLRITGDAQGADTLQDGIFITAGAGVVAQRIHIQRVRAINLGHDGIVCYATGSTNGRIQDLTVEKCYVSGCQDDGINIDDADRVIVKGNICTGMADDGISIAHNGTVQEDNYFIIADNISYSNTGDGIGTVIATPFGDFLDFHDNLCYSNGGDGIGLNGVLDGLVHGNVLQGNTGYGINISSTSDRNNIYGNTIKGNTAGRINVTAGADDNFIHDNYVDGTITDSGTGTIIQDNKGAVNKKQGTIGTYWADAFLSYSGAPDLALRGSVGAGQIRGWALDGAGATEIIVGPTFVIPADISPVDATLDFDIYCGMSAAGSAGQDVTFNAYYKILSGTDQIDETWVVSGTVSSNVSAKVLDEFFTVAISPSTAFTAGEFVQMGVRRGSADAADDYPNDVWVIGVRVRYWREP